ncbi:MAG: TonB-dependent receptor [Bacteroidales bacterium]
MKTNLCALFVLCLLSPVGATNAQERVLTLEGKDLSLATLARALDQQCGVDLCYPPAWEDLLRVDVHCDSADMTTCLESALMPAGVRLWADLPHRIILYKGRSLTSDLAHLQEASPSDPGELSTDMGEESRNPEVSTPERLIPSLVVGKEADRRGRNVARIRGKIRDSGSGEPVIGATMVLLPGGKGAVSDQQGVVSLSVAPGRYQARFSFIGMETWECELDVRSDGEFSVEMTEVVIALNEVQIVGNHYRDINSTDVGVERLSMRSVKQVPLFMGENDVIKISKLLPGITSSGEASVGVNVRGGGADQNIFYINRVPVYNTSHMFGFLSAFNSDIVQDFSIYKGNPPASFGGRLSSVFNILTRKGNLKTHTAHAGISPVSAHATLEGPIVRDRVSLLISGRTSYSDWMLKRLEDPLLRESSASFYDLSAYLHARANDKNEFDLFYYGSRDQFAYGKQSTYRYANEGGSLSWKKVISPALSSHLSLATASYSFGNEEWKQASQAYAHNYRLGHHELFANLDWVPAMNHTLDIGGSVVVYDLNRGRVEPVGEESLRIPVELGEEFGVETSLFASDNIQVLPWMTLYAGLRYSFFSEIGPKTVRSYATGGARTDATVIDSTRYDRFRKVSSESGPEIRLALNMKAGPNTSVKVAFSQMRQYLFMLSNTVTISPTDQWKLSGSHLSAPKGNQVSAGVYHIWPDKGVSASMELYYKHMENIVEYRDGANFISTPYIETQVLQGVQQAGGIELMVQKNSGRFDGWANYTFSRSMVEVDGEEYEQINRGEPYPSNFDRPHVLNVIWSYHLNRRFTFSSNVVYMSGRPVTFPSSLYYINKYVYIDYYAKNQVRVPDYFRIDASLNLEGNLKSRKTFHSSWSLSVYNVLGRNNPQSIFFEPREDFLQGYSFSVIGVPIVTVSWNLKLGNYESN